VDNITHSLFALTLANAGLGRAGRGATAALVVASNLPDIEIVAALTGGRVGYLAAHRGPTHGIPGGLALAVATGAVIWLLVRLSGRRRESASLAALVGVSALAVAGHVAMDLATSYGTRVLSPFSDTWYGVDWMPIVDLALWLVLTAAVIGARLRPEMRVRLAASALALAGADYAVRAAAHGLALDQAVAIQSAAMSAAAPHPARAFQYLSTGRPAALPAALPTWGSPLRWRLITRVPGGFRVQSFDLLRHRLEGEAIVFPSESGPLVSRAANAAIARVFLDFSRFPAADQMRHRNGDTTVHWYDMRFAERPATTADGRRYTSPFAVWIRLSRDGDILGQGLGPG
jgi:inner membrane protein